MWARWQGGAEDSYDGVNSAGAQADYTLDDADRLTHLDDTALTDEVTEYARAHRNRLVRIVTSNAQGDERRTVESATIP